MKDESNIAEQVIKVLGLVFSSVVISGINIAISGHILGYVFNFAEEGENHFTLPLPPVLRVRISGNSVFAGFASFTLSLLLVGCLMSEMAVQIFIHQLDATSSKWVACQSLAAGISVILCLVLGGIRWFITDIFNRKRIERMKKDVLTPEERVRRLIGKE